MTDDTSGNGAAISSCGVYRFWLKRRWADGPMMGFIMLNPSTADAFQDDPTIRRCMGFARREGCGSLIVANLFSLRSTDPAMLALRPNPLGPDADAYLMTVAQSVDGPLVAAWGANGFAARRAGEVISLLGDRLKCLGKTKNGSPRHPLYVKSDQPLLDFPHRRRTNEHGL